MAAKASKLQVPLRLADESDDELVNAVFKSGKWKDHRDALVSCFDRACIEANCNRLRKSGEGATQNVGI